MFDLFHDPDLNFIDLVIGHHFYKMSGSLDSIIRLFVKIIEETGFFRKKESKGHNFLLYWLNNFTRTSETVLTGSAGRLWTAPRKRDHSTESCLTRKAKKERPQGTPSGAGSSCLEVVA